MNTLREAEQGASICGRSPLPPCDERWAGQDGSTYHSVALALPKRDRCQSERVVPVDLGSSGMGATRWSGGAVSLVVRRRGPLSISRKWSPTRPLMALRFRLARPGGWAGNRIGRGVSTVASLASYSLRGLLRPTQSMLLRVKYTESVMNKEAHNAVAHQGPACS